MNSRGLERTGWVGKEEGAEMNLEPEKEGQKRHAYRRRVSLQPLKWQVSPSTRWKVQMITSSLSMAALILLLVMSFSQGWLNLSTLRFLQRWPEDVRQSVLISAQILSHGPLHNCLLQTCSYSKDEEDFLEVWTDHPFFGVAKVAYHLSLVLGFLQATWLYLPYIPGLGRLPFFGWIGSILSFSEVVCLFSSLHCFSIDIWLYETKQNFSVQFGWSYFIGWVVFMIYFICAFLCYSSNKMLWSLIIRTTTSIISYSSSRSSSLES